MLCMLIDRDNHAVVNTALNTVSYRYGTVPVMLDNAYLQIFLSIEWLACASSMDISSIASI